MYTPPVGAAADRRSRWVGDAHTEELGCMLASGGEWDRSGRGLVKNALHRRIIRRQRQILDKSFWVIRFKVFQCFLLWILLILTDSCLFQLKWNFWIIIWSWSKQTRRVNKSNPQILQLSRPIWFVLSCFSLWRSQMSRREADVVYIWLSAIRAKAMRLCNRYVRSVLFDVCQMHVQFAGQPANSL